MGLSLDLETPDVRLKGRPKFSLYVLYKGFIIDPVTGGRSFPVPVLLSRQ